MTQGRQLQVVARDRLILPRSPDVDSPLRLPCQPNAEQRTREQSRLVSN
jgi:hypothetical protein